MLSLLLDLHFVDDLCTLDKVFPPLVRQQVLWKGTGRKPLPHVWVNWPITGDAHTHALTVILSIAM